MRILLVGMDNRIFMPDLQSQLMEHGVEADCMDLLRGVFISNGEEKRIGPAVLTKSFVRKNFQLYRNYIHFRRFFNEHRMNYDVCNIHFLDIRYYFFKRWIFKLSTKLIVTTYGSDFYRYRKNEKFQRTFYKQATAITFSNDATRTAFNEFYKSQYEEKTVICRFGLSNLERLKDYMQTEHFKDIAKAHFGLPLDKMVVTIGYHSNPVHQHLAIIQEIAKLPKEQIDRLHFVLPMAYGGFRDNIDAVVQIMDQYHWPYQIIRDFLPAEDIVKLRHCSDIMINLPKSDQLSATLAEYLFVGNAVITGAWLPYSVMTNAGVHFETVSAVDGLADVLSSVVDDLPQFQQKSAGNNELIWNFSSWSQNIGQWIEIYNK